VECEDNPLGGRFGYVSATGDCDSYFGAEPHLACDGACGCTNNPGTCVVTGLDSYSNPQCTSLVASADAVAIQTACAIASLGGTPGYYYDKVHLGPAGDASCGAVDPAPAATTDTLCMALPLCSSGVCKPPLPGGAKPCLLFDGAEPTCPAELTSRRLVYPDGSGTLCSCSCSQAAPTCAPAATVSFTTYAGPSCGGTAYGALDVVETCTGHNQPFVSYGAFQGPSDNAATASCEASGSLEGGDGAVRTLCCAE
jgi:hypothetical protein